MLKIISDIRNNIHALHVQFLVNIKTNVASTRLGAIWWILDPLLLMLLYTFVVKIIFDRGGEDYHLFALCGIVTWQSFSRSVSICSTALTRNASLIKQSPLPMHLYVLVPPFVQTFFYMIGLSIVALWKYESLGLNTLGIITLVFPMILIPYCLGLYLSIITVKIPDIGKVIPYFLRFGFYMSPVLYSSTRINDLEQFSTFIKQLYFFNPMVHIIEASRDLLLYSKFINLNSYFYIIIITLLFIQIGIFYFRNNERYIPKQI